MKKDCRFILIKEWTINKGKIKNVNCPYPPPPPREMVPSLLLYPICLLPLLPAFLEPVLVHSFLSSTFRFSFYLFLHPPFLHQIHFQGEKKGETLFICK